MFKKRKENIWLSALYTLSQFSQQPYDTGPTSIPIFLGKTET